MTAGGAERPLDFFNPTPDEAANVLTSLFDSTPGLVDGVHNPNILRDFLNKCSRLSRHGELYLKMIWEDKSGNSTKVSIYPDGRREGLDLEYVIEATVAGEKKINLVHRVYGIEVVKMKKEKDGDGKDLLKLSFIKEGSFLELFQDGGIADTFLDGRLSVTTVSS